MSDTGDRLGMNISVVGSGYVGTTVAACLADLGHDVTAVDTDEEIVKTINDGEAPIHQPGLDALLDRHVPERLRATTAYDGASIRETTATFLALPTPARPDGSVDTGYVEAGAQSLGAALDSGDDHLMIVKSTVPPGTTEDIVEPAVRAAAPADVTLQFAMNPEFLREGTAVNDFRNPDKVVLGTADTAAPAPSRTAGEPCQGREPSNCSPRTCIQAGH